ncbi:hypothetical protein Cni_G18682 [Canna indica]|uniref:Uncharacterized protein n=1 Tax=Canna indica TaxID=4628 RepID=A0AAQ3QHX6_9LILI|nr:hypothetical protein Cni_G18682 [Canna indica]
MVTHCTTSVSSSRRRTPTFLLSKDVMRFFVCDADEMELEGFLSAVNTNQELRLGQPYFVLPRSVLGHSLQGPRGVGGEGMVTAGLRMDELDILNMFQYIERIKSTGTKSRLGKTKSRSGIVIVNRVAVVPLSLANNAIFLSRWRDSFSELAAVAINNAGTSKEDGSLPLIASSFTTITTTKARTRLTREASSCGNNTTSNASTSSIYSTIGFPDELTSAAGKSMRGGLGSATDGGMIELP